MSIRAKLYAAIVLTILGPLATTAVALHGMSEMNDRFDEVGERADHASVARELKFEVTDFNGWQTAYGYQGAGGDLRSTFLKSAATLRSELRAAEDTLTEPQEQALVADLQRGFRRFMALDALAYRALTSGDPDRTKAILLGPELKVFESMAQTADDLAAYEDDRADQADTDFDQAKEDARKRLIAVALGAGVVILLLLITANDVARMALEGERSARARSQRETDGDGDA